MLGQYGTAASLGNLFDAQQFFMPHQSIIVKQKRRLRMIDFQKEMRAS